MVHAFKKWMEDRRVSSLQHDLKAFDALIAKSYGKTYSEEHRRRAEERKRSYDSKYLKILGITAAVAIGGLIFADGFLSGAIFVAALGIGGFAIHHHMVNEPDFLAETDLLSQNEMDLRRELLRRQHNSEYDRRRWLSENGYDLAIFSDLSDATVSHEEDEEIEGRAADNHGGESDEPWRLRPIGHDDGTTPAFILTLRKRQRSTKFGEGEIDHWDGLFWIRIEKRNPDGSIEIVEDREWSQWPISWTRDQVESLAREAGYAAFGRDEYVSDEEP